MAGFQKFPVPKYMFTDFWNYNKKWIGNTFFIAFGSFLTFLSAARYAENRHVILLSYVRDGMLVLETILLLLTNLPPLLSRSDCMYDSNEI